MRRQADELMAVMNSVKEEFKPTRDELANIKWQIIEAEKEEKAAAEALRMAQEELKVASENEVKAKADGEQRLDA